MKKHKTLALVAAIILSIFGIFAFANTSMATTASDNSLTSVKFTPLPDNELQVMLAFNNAVTVKPNSFVTEKPARLVFDFPKVHNQLNAKSQTVGIGAAKHFTAVEVGDRTRVVIDLTESVPYRSKAKGNKFLITLAGDQKLASHTSSHSRLKAVSSSAKGMHNIKDVNFRVARFG